MGKECRETCLDLVAFVLLVVNDHADIDLRMDPSTDVSHEDLSLMACSSSVVTDFLRFLSSNAGQESISDARRSFSKFRRMRNRMTTRNANKEVERIEMTEI